MENKTQEQLQDPDKQRFEEKISEEASRLKSLAAPITSQYGVETI